MNAKNMLFIYGKKPTIHAGHKHKNHVTPHPYNLLFYFNTLVRENDRERIYVMARERESKMYKVCTN